MNAAEKAERAFSSLFLSLRRYLEELHADAGEHKLQQRGDDDDVADGADGHKHALNHVLEGGREDGECISGYLEYQHALWYV